MGISAEHFTAVRRPAAIVLTAGALLLAVFLLAGPAASTAEAGQPPICQQYPDLPQCQDPSNNPPNPPPGNPGFCEDHPSNPQCVAPTGGAGGPNDGFGPTGSAGDGDLPFTGYPITALVLLLLVILVLGLSIRAYLAARERTAARNVSH